MYALAVRDDQLYLILRVRRKANGEIFHMFPRENREGWDPHGSYYKDGKHHQKSFDHKIFSRQGPKPDPDFKGSINLVTTSIMAGEHKAINVICQPSEFDQVFEMSAHEISGDQDRQTTISLDITSPGVLSNIIGGARVVRSWTLKDVIPWIVLTVYEFSLADFSTVL
jgi:hypothetical protein